MAKKNQPGSQRNSFNVSIPQTIAAALTQELLRARELTQRVEAARKRKRPKKAPVDNWGNVVRGYRRSLALGVFADAGRAPRISDVEVAVCFADIRGFTKYVHALQKEGQDNRVQHFLRAYFRIYTEAVLNIMWTLEPDRLDQEQTATDSELNRLVVPTSFKNLGDGMMLVWELQRASSKRVAGLASRMIYQVVEEIRDRFQELVKVEGSLEIDSYSKHARNLQIGFGLSRGHAWRLDFGHHMPVDYAGSIVNLAARLQDLARPSGVVAQLGFSESLFYDMQKERQGRIGEVPAPRGFGKGKVEVWKSKDVG